jgi:hypothetical protein
VEPEDPRPLFSCQTKILSNQKTQDFGRDQQALGRINH